MSSNPPVLSNIKLIKTLLTDHVLLSNEGCPFNWWICLFNWGMCPFGYQIYPFYWNIFRFYWDAPCRMMEVLFQLILFPFNCLSRCRSVVDYHDNCGVICSLFLPPLLANENLEAEALSSGSNNYFSSSNLATIFFIICIHFFF